MRILFFGTPQFAVPTLQRLLSDPRFTVLGVVTQPDKRRGRGNQLQPSPVKQVALAHQLSLWQPTRIKRSSQTLAALRSLQADVFVVVAYGQILSPEILAMPRLGCINNHGSLLPRYRGAAPIQWAIYHGETVTGMTTMLMDAGMDTGAMLLKATLPIGLLEDTRTIAARMAALGADLMAETLVQWEQGEIQPQPQEPDQATYAPLIQKSDFLIDWSRSAIALHNQVRAFVPNCLAQFRNTPLKIIATVPLGTAFWGLLPPALQALQSEWSETQLQASSSPGTVIGVAKSLGPIVQTGAGALLLQEVQLAGKRQQSAWNFVNGVRLGVGEVIGNGQISESNQKD